MFFASQNVYHPVLSIGADDFMLLPKRNVCSYKMLPYFVADVGRMSFFGRDKDAQRCVLRREPFF